MTLVQQPEQLPAAEESAESSDRRLVELLLSGDESAFANIVDRWSAAMLRVARSRVSTLASAEEIVQETWLAVITGLDGFEGRSALRTWVFRILENKAKTRGVREARTVPWSAVTTTEVGPTVDASRFSRPGDPWEGHWADDVGPRAWAPDPDDALMASELRLTLRAALEELPQRQRLVVSMRDVDGMNSEEVCDALLISAGNQRVLLHRGRARLRLALELRAAALDVVEDTS